MNSFLATYRRPLLTSLTMALLGLVSACGGSQPAARQAATVQADEARVCAGVPEQVHQSSPIFQRDLVSQVTPIYREERHGRATIQQLRGAEIHVQATPGMTAPYLQRSLECHMVRRELGRVAHHDVPSDPLWLPSGPTSVRVAETSHGFVVAIEGRDTQQAREVYSRALTLVRTDAAASYASTRTE